ncbi:hypothetical protein SUDANB176_07383 [Streptomyces sp. enrichment culture]
MTAALTTGPEARRQMVSRGTGEQRTTTRKTVSVGLVDGGDRARECHRHNRQPVRAGPAVAIHAASPGPPSSARNDGAEDLPTSSHSPLSWGRRGAAPQACASIARSVRGPAVTSGVRGGRSPMVPHQQCRSDGLRLSVRGRETRTMIQTPTARRRQHPHKVHEDSPAVSRSDPGCRPGRGDGTDPPLPADQDDGQEARGRQVQRHPGPNSSRTRSTPLSAIGLAVRSTAGRALWHSPRHVPRPRLTRRNV